MRSAFIWLFSENVLFIILFSEFCNRTITRRTMSKICGHKMQIFTITQIILVSTKWH